MRCGSLRLVVVVDSEVVRASLLPGSWQTILDLWYCVVLSTPCWPTQSRIPIHSSNREDCDCETLFESLSGMRIQRHPRFPLWETLCSKILYRLVDVPEAFHAHTS